MLPSRRPRSVFISGAGRGIGRATAGLFLARGWRVGMYDVDADVVAGAAAGRDGAVHGAAEGHRYLKRSTRGLLLNLCSASALYGQPTLATYGATKAAVKSLTEALDIEWRRDGIRVRSLLPLFVATEMVIRDGVRAAGVGSLGVRLTAEDVAAAAWKVAHERRRLLASPHRPVGRQTRVLAAASAVTPDWANRLMVRRIAG